jgi:hypothetical protein
MEDKEDSKKVECLDMIRRLEDKFIVLCKVDFGINFKVTNWDPSNEKETIEVVGTLGFPRTSSNPINVEDELREYTKEKATTYKIHIHFGPTKTSSS